MDAIKYSPPKAEPTPLQKGGQQRVACFSEPKRIESSRGDAMNTESVFYRAANAEGLVAGGACGTGLRYPTGRVPLGKRRNRPEHRNAHTAVQAVRRFHQYASGVAPGTCSANAAGCRWTTRPSAENPTAPSTRNTANGAIRTGNLFIKVWTS